MTEEQIEAAMADPECARANEICRLAAATVADRLREECDGFDDRQAAAAAERSVDARAGLLRGDSGTVGQGRQPVAFDGGPFEVARELRRRCGASPTEERQ